MKKNKPTGLTRRAFLQRTAATASVLAVPAVHGQTSRNNDPVRQRDFGKTGLKVSEIGFGGFPTKDADVVGYAIDKGITYFDTAHCYTGGRSEKTIGEGLKGKRDKVVLTTKWHPYSNTTAEEMMRDLEGSLKRLKTDYVDCLLVHQVGKRSGGESVERLDNPELAKACAQAKEQGKARFFGCSGHDGDMVEVMEHALGIEFFDVILMRYNFMSYPDQPKLIRKAKEKGFATTAMKTLSGARGTNISDFRTKQTSFKQAALKWVLSNGDLSNLIISISNRKQVDEYAAASGKPMNLEDYSLLQDYRNRFGQEVCRSCNQCEEVCPSDVHVADILRYRMYEKDYAFPGEGKKRYAAMPGARYTDACVSCNAPCLGACPHGIDVPKELLRADQLLA